MKILMFSRRVFPRVGGVEKHVGEISKSLVKRGHEVVIMAEKDGDDLKDYEKIDNIIVRRVSYPRVKYWGLLVLWIKLLKNYRLVANADLVHVHDVFIWYWPFRFLYPRKRVYVTFHGWEGVYPIPKINIFQKRMAAKLAKGNICVGKYIEKYYGVRADKIVYGGVEIPARSLAAKMDRIVYVGRLEKDTGLPILLEVLRKLKSKKIDFCGDGPLRKECEKYGEVHGFCDPKPFLKRAKICLGAGYLSILEAMANKCLVVVADDNCLKKDYYGLTVFSKWLIRGESSEEIAVKMKKLLARKRVYKQMTEEAYKWVGEQSWDKIVDDYLELWGAKNKRV